MMKNRTKLLSFAIVAFFSPSLAFATGVAESTSELTTPTLGDKASYTLSTSESSNFSIKKYLIENTSLIETTLYVDIKDVTGSNDTTSYYTWTYDTENRKVTLTESTDGTSTYDFSANYDSSTARLSTMSENLTTNFVSISGSDNGGAIYNGSTTAYSITGDFIYNSISGDAFKSGGAIFNLKNCSIGSITGNFIGNYATSTFNGTQGGAIYNHTSASIGDITGDFIGNYTYGDELSNASTSVNTVTASGGAIANTGTISSITGDFISNYASTYSDGAAIGGAITNTLTIGTITGDFIENAAYTGTTGDAQGGAIYNTGTITIAGDFVGNYAYSPSGTAQGGAVYNTKTVNFTATDNADSTGNSYYYIGNYAGTSDGKSDASGGFLYQTSAGTSNFTIGTNSSIVIGDGTSGYDSIAGEGSIVVSGGGSLTVNSSMEYYTGSLTVSAGSMEVNNTLSASNITVSSGASLAVDTLNVYLSDATSSLNLNVASDATFTLDALAIYLDETFIANVDSYVDTEIDIIGDTSIVEFTAYYYDASSEAYTELSDDSYTFENGVFTLTAAVPEPSTYAMIIGVLSLGFAYYRRRK